MNMWEVILVTTAATVVADSGQVKVNESLNTGLIHDHGTLNIGKRLNPAEHNLGSSLMEEQTDLDSDLNPVMQEQNGLDETGILLNNTGHPRKSDKENKSEQRSSTKERIKGCTPTILCSRVGGFCVKSNADCNGIVDPSGCKGGKKCKCCIPDSSVTTTPLTCPAVTCAPPATTVSPTEATTVSDNLNWLSVGSDRFIRVDQRLKWTEARNFCRSQGLDIYTPRNSTAVSKYLADNFSNGGTMWHWLGGRANGTHMLWVTGDVLTRDDPWYISRGGYYTHVGTNACLWTITNSGWVETGKGVLNTQNDSCDRDNTFYAVCG